MSRPLIGITSGFAHIPTIGGPLPIHYVGTHLASAVWEAGGLPWIMPALPEAAQAVAEQLDGLLLGGGADVNPGLYGDSARPGTQIDERRDRFELALIQHALERNLPILGTCRGIQILSVALGGMLYQDLSTDRPTSVTHLQSLPASENHHQVTLYEDSRLAKILGSTTVQVNSLHHQGVEDPGPRLRVVGYAEDGLIEAVEIPDLWVIAVQWHPEFLYKARPEALATFKALVEASQNRANGSGRSSGVPG